MLVYRKGYSPDFVFQVISQNELSGLRIFDHLEPLSSLDFLREFSFLKKLSIDCINDQDYSFLKTLTNLTSLEIGLSVTFKNAIDLSNQANLEELYLDWRKKKIFGLDQCNNLLKLSIAGFNENDISKLSSIRNLRSVRLVSSSIKSLDGIDGLIELSNLELLRCGKLISIDALTDMLNLNSVIFKNCPNIESFKIIGTLKELKSFEITDCKNVDSIKFLNNLGNLDKFVMCGNTVIEDGDLTAIQHLKDVIYKHRQSYNVNFENNKQDQIATNNRELLNWILEGD
jgi:hypothetical protein